MLWTKSCIATIQMKCILAPGCVTRILSLYCKAIGFIKLDEKKEPREKILTGSLRSLMLYVKTVFKQIYATFLRAESNKLKLLA